MTNDDNIDELIRNAASDYNRPPATPRDDMWKAIQAARSAQSGPRLHVTAGGAASSGGYSAAGRSTPRYAWLGLAAAAVLLVATGIGIGRWTSPTTPAGSRIADAPSSNPQPGTGEAALPAGSDTAPAEVGPAATELAESSAPARENSAPAVRTRDDIRRNPVVTGTRELRRVAGRSDDGRRSPANGEQAPGNGSVQAVSYQLATQQHLQDAEMLLTSFALESPDERMNSQFAGWAKGLLSNTRLLLDSPAGDDPRRARLLQDLELVLAQIVQLSPDAQASDRELIQGNIQNGLVMTRLRSAIPAGQPREITER